MFPPRGFLDGFRVMRLTPCLVLTMAIIVGASVVPLSAASQPQSTPLPFDLASALDAYNKATINRDIATLAELVTDDYMLVNSDASVQDKASYLADFEMPGFRLESYVIEQPIYRVRGDAGLTGGTFRLNWVQEGRHHSRRLRISHLWFKRNGRWRIDYTQLTRIPE